MLYTNLSNKELVRHVDNTCDATPLERELASRLDELAVEIEMQNALLREKDAVLQQTTQLPLEFGT